MAIKYYSGQFALGTAAERGAATWTGSPNGYRFLETDTLKTYIWSGSAWFEQVVTAGGGGTLGVSAGGTGATTLTGILKGNGTSAVTAGATVTVAEGGTGATTLTGILNGNGTSAFTAVTAPSGAIVGDTDTQTLTNKTLTSPIISSISNTGTVTLPTSTDTLVGKATTDTLTNKTLTTPTLTTPVLNGVTFGDVAITNSDSPYTVLATKTVIRADATSGVITINLPTAASVAGRVYTIKRTDVIASTNLITIDAASTETIDGNLTHILNPAEWVVLESDGTNWQVIGRPAPAKLGYSFTKNSTNNRRYIAGMGDNFNALIVSTTSPAVNTLWALPLFVARTTQFDTITFHITSVSTAGNSRAGIYRDNGNNYPGALMFDTGSIVTTGTGVKDTTITSSLQILQPGLYWLAYEQDTATGQMVCIPAGGAIIAINGYSGASLQTNPSYGYSVAHTYGSLPDPYTASATLLSTSPAVGNPVPAIGLRPI